MSMTTGSAHWVSSSTRIIVKLRALHLVVGADRVDLGQLHVAVGQPEDVLGRVVGRCRAVGRREQRAEHELEVGQPLVGLPDVEDAGLLPVLLDVAKDQGSLAVALAPAATTAEEQVHVLGHAQHARLVGRGRHDFLVAHRIGSASIAATYASTEGWAAGRLMTTFTRCSALETGRTLVTVVVAGLQCEDQGGGLATPGLVHQEGHQLVLLQAPGLGQSGGNAIVLGSDAHPGAVVQPKRAGDAHLRHPAPTGVQDGRHVLVGDDRLSAVRSLVEGRRTGLQNGKAAGVPPRASSPSGAQPGVQSPSTSAMTLIRLAFPHPKRPIHDLRVGALAVAEARGPALRTRRSF